jgi:hypothetical protein
MTEHTFDKPRGWIGIDLDGTLAHYTTWHTPDHIGAPIPRMVHLVKLLLDAGWDVRILTARVGPQKQPQDRVYAAQAIRAWTMKHLGQELPCTHEKDFAMVWMFDDRCTQVFKNSGVLIGREHLPEALNTLEGFDPSI